MKISAEQFAKLPNELKACFQSAHSSECEVVALFPQTTTGGGARNPNGAKGVVTKWGFEANDRTFEANTGSAARFFYCAKASKKDRNEGLEGFEEKTKRIYSGGITSADHPETASGGGDRQSANNHPTVKPTELMRYLVRLVTPPGGTVLDPFAGSGSTGKAASLEGFKFIGIEKEAEYAAIAQARIDGVREPLFV